MTQRHVSFLTLFLLTGAAVCSAQSITTARSGTLHYFDGDVSIDGEQVHQQRAIFPQIHEQGVLRTGLGRAEVLLTPGVFLRVGENSAIRMVDERLISTRVEILEGTAMVESDDPQMSVKDSPVTFIYRDYEIRPLKHGLLEISADKAQMKVFKGEAAVAAGENRTVVREGHLVPFSAALASEKFSDKEGDDLYVWTRDRSESLAAANVASAQSLTSGSGYGYASDGLYGTSPWTGGWYMNPYLGMYTFVPAAGMLWNPFGYGFFSPAMVSYYVPSGGGGGSGAGLAPAIRGGAAAGTPSLGSPIRGGGVSSASAASAGSGLNAVSRGGSFGAAGGSFGARGAGGGGVGHGGGHR